MKIDGGLFALAEMKTRPNGRLDAAFGGGSARHLSAMYVNEGRPRDDSPRVCQWQLSMGCFDKLSNEGPFLRPDRADCIYRPTCQ